MICNDFVLERFNCGDSNGWIWSRSRALLRDSDDCVEELKLGDVGVNWSDCLTIYFWEGLCGLRRSSSSSSSSISPKLWFCRGVFD